MLPCFAVKKKETVFYNITHKLRETHLLKTLLERDFQDLKYGQFATVLYLFVAKFVNVYLGLTNV